MLWRSVISKTNIAEVNGVRVTPVKKPTMPDKINKFVFESDKCINPERKDPTLAPALNAGAKIPPDEPVVNESTGPAILINGMYQGKYLCCVNKVVAIISLPEPKTLSSIKYAHETIINAQLVM